MATSRTFNDMLNDHLNYDLLQEELKKRSYIFQRAQIDNDWKGGTLPVPFRGARASSIAMGSLTASTDVAEAKFVRGEITSQPELWGTMIFNHRDIMEHDGRVKEKSFLKLLAEETIPDFLEYVKNATSVMMLSNAYFAKATADGDASGNLTVDRPERFDVNQKVTVKDSNTAATDVFVKTVNINTGVINFVTTRGGSTPADLSNYTTAQSAVCYYDGADDGTFTSLKNSLLSATNGGASTLYGQTKTAYPYLQAINVSGATITAANIVEKIFDAYTTLLKVGQGGSDKECLMSYKNLGSVMKALESGKGAYHIVQNSQKVTAYGWSEIMIMGVAGTLKVVGIQEMDDDCIFLMDWSAVKIHSNGFFRKRMAPDGRSYFEVRNTTGYAYIQDVCFFGDLVLNRPSRCGVIHSISY